MAGNSQRVAVVGGGIAGSLCSLVLRNRGLRPTVFDAGKKCIGGRLGSRKKGAGDRGTQFIRASQGSRLIEVLSLLEQNGLVAPWSGRFGLLGSQGGGFLPQEVISTSTMGMRKAVGDDDEARSADAAAWDSGDFCGFIGTGGSQAPPLYVATPSMAGLCDRICDTAGIEYRKRAKVSGLTFDAGSTSWKVNVVSQDASGTEIGQLEGFDGIVIAAGVPTLAAATVRSLGEAPDRWDVDAVVQATGVESPALAARLLSLARKLEGFGNPSDHVPLIVLSALFPSGALSDNLPFDAVTCPSSPDVQLIVREASKPGRTVGEGDEIWTAVSTVAYARDALITSEPAEEQVAIRLMDKFSRLLAPYYDQDTRCVPKPLHASAKIWRRALPGRTLGLKEDCIALEPWRLAICGDFVGAGAASPFEAAALSGLEAGERVASWFASSS